jgi:hypothetical protein
VRWRYRRFNEYPVVLAHVEGFRSGVDVEACPTYDQATELAHRLLEAADMISSS